MLLTNLSAWYWSSPEPYFLFFSLQHNLLLWSNIVIFSPDNSFLKQWSSHSPACFCFNLLLFFEPSGPLLAPQLDEAQRRAVHTRYLFNSYSKDPGPLEKASSKHSQGIVKKKFLSTIPCSSSLDSRRETCTDQNYNTSQYSRKSYPFTIAHFCICYSLCLQDLSNPHLEHLLGNFHVQIAVTYKSSTPSHFSLSSLNIFLPPNIHQRPC